MSLPRALAICLLALLAGACSEDDVDDVDDASDNPPDSPGSPSPPSASACTPITGGATTVDFASACASCSIENAAAAIDGNPATYATIVLDGPDGGLVALRATAQSGVVFGPLANPGAIISIGSSDLTLLSNLELRTYLMGVPTNTDTSLSPTIVGGSGGGSPQRASFLAAAPFDAVEVGWTRVDTGAVRLNVHEFCSD